MKIKIMKRVIKRPKRASALIKNYQRLLKLVFGEKEFLKDIFNIQRKWSLPKQKQGVDFMNSGISDRKLKIAMRERYKARHGFFDGLEKKRKEEFIYDVLNLLNQYKLGLEWFFSITDIIVASFFKPPSYNIDFGVVSGRFCIILNPNTSLNDIKRAWGKIEEKRKQLYSTAKRNYIKKKFPQHLKLYLADLLLPQKAKAPDPNLGGEIQYRKNDLDKVGELFPNAEDISQEADKRRANYLRQIRRRMKT